MKNKADSKPEHKLEIKGDSKHIFSNKWEVKCSIGKGAFSEIFAAFEKDTRKPVAIKLQNSGIDSSLMKWESHVLSSLTAMDFVPKLIHYGQEEGRDFLVMELLTGDDMSVCRDRLRRHCLNHLIPCPVAGHLILHMLANLRAMHETGFVHRDIKPSNFVRRSHSGSDFCMIDFGLAKQYRDSFGRLKAQREHVEFRGTTIYASPYAHLGKDQSPRDDLFSMLFVYMDFVLGNLPWRHAAKQKNKAQVKALKAMFTENIDEFFLVFTTVTALSTNVYGPASVEDHVKEMINQIKPSIERIAAHLSQLSYDEAPDYAFVEGMLLQCDPESSTRNREEYQSYCRQRFQELSDMSTPARAILSRRVDDEGLKNNNSNTNNNSSSAKRPRLSAVGSVTEMAIEKQQNLRKAIQSLWEESRLYNEARDAQEVAMRKSSFFMASHRKPSLSLTSFKVANKWRLLVEDLLTLPEDLIEEEVLSQFSKLLYAHHSFFRSDLGECNELGKDFFDVQMTAASFYRIYAAKKQSSRQKLEATAPLPDS